LGVWERPFQAVADEPDPQGVMVDATALRARRRGQRAQPQGSGGRRARAPPGGFSTKPHVLVDARPNRDLAPG
jgi:hypothetical protein